MPPARRPLQSRCRNERGATWTLFEDRASTQVLGFALMFSLTMTTFAIYQADVVPHQNRQEEFEHNQAMAEELAELRSAMQTAGTTDAAAAAVLNLGPSYPTRALAINPPTPTGRLATSEPHPVYVRGLKTDAGRYWDGDAKTFHSRHLNYTISYNRIDGARYLIEQGMVVKRYADGGGRSLSAPPVNGNRISLALLAGDYERVGLRESVEVRPVSSTTETVTVTAQRLPSGYHLRMPTQLPRSDWESIQDSQPHIVAMAYGTNPGHGNYVRLRLEGGRTYELRVTRVTLGQPSSPEAAYITSATGNVLSVPKGGAKPVTFTAHDRYGNPVESASIELKVDGSGTLGSTSLETGADGTVRTMFSGGGDNPGKVKAWVDDGNNGYEKTSVSITRPSIAGTNTIYTSGQMVSRPSGFAGLRFTDGRTVPLTDTNCLLVGDTGGGLLGGLLGSLNCDSDTIRTIQGSLLLEKPSGESLQLRYYLYDENGNGQIDGDDGMTLRIRDMDGNKIFVGELTDTAAQDVLESSGVALTKPSNYRSSSWGSDGGWFSSGWGTDDPYSSFGDLQLDTVEYLFADQAYGRITIETGSG